MEISPALVPSILSILKPTKFVVPDGIHSSFLRMLVPIIPQSLATLLFFTLSYDYVQEDWHPDVITPFLKKGTLAEV